MNILLLQSDFGESRGDLGADPYAQLDRAQNGEDGPEDAQLRPEDRMTSMDVGTPLYKSPEMVDDNISVPSMDLWALGCMIYEMLTGATPFADTNEYEVY